MKILNLVSLVLVIIGGLSWGLVGLFNLDLISTVATRLIYILIGLSALWQLVPLYKQFWVPFQLR